MSAIAESAPVRQKPASRIFTVRLLRLFLASRQVPAALLVLAGCGAMLRLSSAMHWIQGDFPLNQQVPMLLEAGAAVVVGVTARSPFGEVERATGRVVPKLRLGTAVGLGVVAVGTLLAAMLAAPLPGGAAVAARTVAGLAGIALLGASVLGGALAWVGPMAYLGVTELGLSVPWTSPWIWPARPAHDLGADLASAAVCLAGLVVVAVFGARDSNRDE